MVHRIILNDLSAHGIGKLHTASITAGPSSGYQRTYGYDSMSRPVNLTTIIAGTAYLLSASYDANSRLSQVSYPSGFVASYVYTSLGYSSELVNGVTGEVYWTANARDAELHLTQQTAGNGSSPTKGLRPRPDACSTFWRARTAASRISPTPTTSWATF